MQNGPPNMNSAESEKSWGESICQPLEYTELCKLYEATTLNINAIYTSISGEGGFIPQGAYCTIIRLQGCTQTCSYCDAPETRNLKPLKIMSVEQIAAVVATRYVLITGGEPLLQAAKLCVLLKKLTDKDCICQIETNGVISMQPFMQTFVSNASVYWVVDWKGESSGIRKAMGSYADFCARLLKYRTYVKFVIADEVDMADALCVMMHVLQKQDLRPGMFLLSPVDARTDLVALILNTLQSTQPMLLTSGAACISLQMHKIVKLP